MGPSASAQDFAFANVATVTASVDGGANAVGVRVDGNKGGGVGKERGADMRFGRGGGDEKDADAL